MKNISVLFVVFAVLIFFGAALAVHSVQAAASDDFDINACYAKCGCHWGLFQACYDCKQNCDRQYWKSFDERTSDKSQKNSQDY